MFSFTENGSILYGRYDNEHGQIVLGSKVDRSAIPTFTCIGSFGYPLSVTLPSGIDDFPNSGSPRLFSISQSGMVDVMSGYSINGANIDEICARKTDLGNNTQLMESSAQRYNNG